MQNEFFQATIHQAGGIWNRTIKIKSSVYYAHLLNIDLPENALYIVFGRLFWFFFSAKKGTD
jgi:hypothetical protein